MDRLKELRAKNNLNVSVGNLDISASASDVSLGGYQTANDSSSASFLSFDESTINFSPSKQVIPTEITGPKELEVPKTSDKLDSLLISENPVTFPAGENISDDNSYDGNELVIDDNAAYPDEDTAGEGDKTIENNCDDKKEFGQGQEDALKLLTVSENSKQTKDDIVAKQLDECKNSKINICHSSINTNVDVNKKSKKVIVEEIEGMQDLIPLDVAQELLEAEDSTNEVKLQIDGKNVDAIDIGNGLYLYRKDDIGELTAIQIIPGENQQTQCKFLKVRHNDDGNLEVYEEQILEVPLTEEEVNAANKQTEIEKKSSSKVDCKMATTKSNKQKLPTENVKTSSIFDEAKLSTPEIRNSPFVNNIQSPVQPTTSKEFVPLSKSIIDRHLPTNKIESTGTKSPKEILTVKTGNFITSTSKLSPQFLNSKHSPNSLNTDKVTCTALLPFKPPLDILFGGSKTQMVSSINTQTEHKTADQQSEANLSPLKKNVATDQISTSTIVFKTYSRSYKSGEKKNKMPQEQNVTKSNAEPTILTFNAHCEEKRTNLKSNTSTESFKHNPVIASKKSSKELDFKSVEANCENVMKQCSIQKVIDKCEKSNIERTIKENKFVNKYISEALGVKNVTSNTIESLKSSTEKINVDKKSITSQKPINNISKVNEPSSNEEFVTKELSTQALINKTIDDIILERLLAPSKPLNMVNADTKMTHTDRKNFPSVSSPEFTNLQNKSKQTEPTKHEVIPSLKTQTAQKSDHVKNFKSLYQSTELIKPFPVKAYPLPKLDISVVPKSTSFERQFNLNINNPCSDAVIEEKIKEKKFDEVFAMQPTKFKEAYQSALSVKMSKEPLRLENLSDHCNNTQNSSKTSPVPIILNPPTVLHKKNESPKAVAIPALNSLDDKQTAEKTKHQRKQTLQPVEVADLEIICGPTEEEHSTNKKRKTEKETLHAINKLPSQIQHKKNYLLGRTPVSDNDRVDKGDNISLSMVNTSTPKRGRGRPKKNSDQGHSTPSPKKSPKSTKEELHNEVAVNKSPHPSSSETDSDEEGIPIENWSMGKINENIVCPICSKLFRSESVVFKHVKHCGGPDKPSPKSKQSPISPRPRTSTGILQNKESNTPNEESCDPQAASQTTENSITATQTVIEIEDSPALCENNTNNELKEKVTLQKKSQLTPLSRMQKVLKYKPPDTSSYACETCGKSFRQLSYLISHRAAHKSEITKKEIKVSEASNNSSSSVLKCEICQKGFRKPYHLVQHRLIHNTAASSRNVESFNPQVPVKANMVETKEVKTQNTITTKPQDVNTAGFRCEACDKSFRKLHHLVEHREIHENSNKLKPVPGGGTTADKSNDIPTCDVCHKTFRKLHHLIDHRELHVNKNGVNPAEDDNKLNVLPRDIIHECSICYMVFPNEFSLNKHHIKCEKKRKIPKNKKDSDITDQKIEEKHELESEKDERVELPETVQEENEKSKPNNSLDEKVSLKEVPPQIVVSDTKNAAKESTAIIKSASTLKRNSKDVTGDLTASPQKMSKLAQKRKSIGKIKPKSAKNLLENHDKKEDSKKQVRTEFIDNDDEVRYMINPMYEEGEKEIFFNVRSPEQTRLKSPEKTRQKSPEKTRQKSPEKSRRKSRLTSPIIASRKTSVSSARSNLASTSKSITKTKITLKTEQKFKVPDRPIRVSSAKKTNPVATLSPNVVSRRKSLVHIPKLVKPPEQSDYRKGKPQVSSNHICDCGEKFTCEALLLRHTAVAHTPPRIRRNRGSDQSSSADGKNVKEIVRSIKKTSLKKKVPHTGVPTTDRMKQIYAKLKL